MGLMTRQEARTWLLNHNFIELPFGSYVHWIEKQWFERYKAVLVEVHGLWLPRKDRLPELRNLDEAYSQYHWKQYAEEQAVKQLGIEDE